LLKVMLLVLLAFERAVFIVLAVLAVIAAVHGGSHVHGPFEAPSDTRESRIWAPPHKARWRLEVLRTGACGGGVGELDCKSTRIVGLVASYRVRME
jgi:hypothetical protein